MSTPDPRLTVEALAAAEEIAREAGALVLSGFRSGVAVEKKGRADLLTEYDLRSEALIRKRLAGAFPDHAIVGEEGAPTGDSDLVWYVDPIDGTTNFAHGHPIFCVSIALYDGARGLVGVIHAPALDVTWTGRLGGGAMRNGVPCRVSACDDLADALCATGFPTAFRTRDDDNVREYRTFLKRTVGVRRGGSAALDLAMVADGTFDAYWEQPLNPWDFGAGALLVLEAGGRLTDLDGAEVDPRHGPLVATNGLIHDAVVATLREARPG